MGTAASPLPPHRVLVAFGSQRGGTAGIAKIIGETLRGHGLEVDVAPVDKVHGLKGYDAAIVGGALYANLWHPGIRRFVNHHVAGLRRIPVWMFSSGPLDDSADKKTIPPPRQVAVLGERVGARGHRTFGGRLAPDAKGFPASAMAKTSAGDWRNPERIRAWAEDVARVLPEAKPGVAVDHPGRSWFRLLAHAVTGWAIVALLVGGLLLVVRPGVALAFQLIIAPLAFTEVANRYFQARGARDPLPTALVFAAVVLALDAALAMVAGPRITGAIAAIVGGGALLGVLATWLTGFVVSTLPWPKPPAKPTGPNLPKGSVLT
jgi:menaquinone-dependent protoporphyrinogen oxidase